MVHGRRLFFLRSRHPHLYLFQRRRVLDVMERSRRLMLSLSFHRSRLAPLTGRSSSRVLPCVELLLFLALLSLLLFYFYVMRVGFAFFFLVRRIFLSFFLYFQSRPRFS
jgi:hypothetical protein